MVDTPRKYKVLVIAPTCFYYQVPIFKRLASDTRIDLTVYFCSDEALRARDVRYLFKSDSPWGGEEELLKGYEHKFLRNFSPWPTYLQWPVGLMNLGIWGVIRREKPDVVIGMAWTNLTWWVALFASLFSRVPFLYMNDGNLKAELAQGKWKVWIKKLLLGKVLFRLSSGFLSSGTANNQLYEHYGVPESKIVPFSYSWVHQNLLPIAGELKKQKNALRAELGIPEESFVILFSGRLIREKGPFQLLEAYRKLQPKHKVLVIMGDGEVRRRLQEYVAEHKIESVYFCGFQNRKQVPKYYAISDVLVLPSTRDTWGMVVNEALCFELPVIVSDQVGAGQDLIIHAHNGFSYPVGDVDQLAQHLQGLVEIPEEERAAMGARSLELIEKWAERDSTDSMLRYLDLFYAEAPAATPVRARDQTGSNLPLPTYVPPAAIKNGRQKYKVAIVAPTCFYYQVAIFRELAANSRIDLTVYFCSEEGLNGKEVLRNFNTDSNWGVEDGLLDGYDYKFVRNYSPFKSYQIWPFGLMNFGIWREIGRTKPDAVVMMSWSHFTPWLTVLACLRFRRPFLYTTDANIQSESFHPFWKNWTKKILLGKGLFRLASGFLTAGTANERLYRHFGVPDEKLVPFAYHTGFESFLQASNELQSQRSQIKLELGIPEKSFVVLFCGRLVKEKRPLELLKAFQRAKLNDKALVFVGDGKLKPPLIDYAASHDVDSVHFLGFRSRSDLLKCYAMADVLVLPSFHEPWGMVVNEAMCFGLPTIVSDHVGSGEDLVRHGHNGFRVADGNVDELANALQQIMAMPKDERQAMGSRSKEMVERWAQKDLAQSFLQHLDSMYSRKDPRDARDPA